MKVAIVGANGYSGVELIRLLSQHPHVEIEKLVSHSSSDTAINIIYPHLTGICELELEKAEAKQIAECAELVFFATPAGVSQGLVPELLDKGITCIDLSGDFRLKHPKTYEQWYKRPFTVEKAYLEKGVYGLSEINRETIKTAQLIANPGCYATATLLGLLPAVQMGLIDLQTIVIDGKSGVSGAGRSAKQENIYSEINGGVKAYKIGVHQHIPEIEQEIASLAGVETQVTFTTHLIPMTRGMMCTIYARLREAQPTLKIIEDYKEYYQSEHFVRVRDEGIYPVTKEVSGSNYCDIGIFVDERVQRLTIISVIDNLVKGAAGQAIQNMNIIYGWDETVGLDQVPIYP